MPFVAYIPPLLGNACRGKYWIEKSNFTKGKIRGSLLEKKLKYEKNTIYRLLTVDLLL